MPYLSQQNHSPPRSAAHCPRCIAASCPLPPAPFGITGTAASPAGSSSPTEAPHSTTSADPPAATPVATRVSRNYHQLPTACCDPRQPQFISPSTLRASVEIHTAVTLATVASAIRSSAHLQLCTSSPIAASPAAVHRPARLLAASERAADSASLPLPRSRSIEHAETAALRNKRFVIATPPHHSLL